MRRDDEPFDSRTRLKAANDVHAPGEVRTRTLLVHSGGGNSGARSPVLVNLKRPVELEVGLLVVVNEAGGNVVQAADSPAGRCRLLLDWNKHVSKVLQS